MEISSTSNFHWEASKRRLHSRGARHKLVNTGRDRQRDEGLHSRENAATVDSQKPATLVCCDPIPRLYPVFRWGYIVLIDTGSRAR